MLTQILYFPYYCRTIFNFWPFPTNYNSYTTDKFCLRLEQLSGDCEILHSGTWYCGLADGKCLRAPSLSTRGPSFTCGSGFTVHGLQTTGMQPDANIQYQQLAPHYKIRIFIIQNKKILK